MFAARVRISTGCPWWPDPPWDFGSSQAPIPLCSAARFQSLLAPSRLPRRRLAVPGRHDSRRRRRTNRRPGAARPTASPLPRRAAVPTFPVRSGLRRAAPTKPTYRSSFLRPVHGRRSASSTPSLTQPPEQLHLRPRPRPQIRFAHTVVHPTGAAPQTPYSTILDLLTGPRQPAQRHHPRRF